MYTIEDRLKMGAVDTDAWVEGVIGIGIVLYVVRYFLVTVIMDLLANETTATYTPLITLIIVFIFLGLMLGGYRIFLKGSRA